MWFCLQPFWMSSCRERTGFFTSGHWRNAGWTSASSTWCLNAAPSRSVWAVEAHHRNTRSNSCLKLGFRWKSIRRSGLLMWVSEGVWLIDLIFNSCLFVYFQALNWIQETGEVYLTTHTSPGDSSEETQQLLNDFYQFRLTAKVHFCAPLMVTVIKYPLEIHWWVFCVFSENQIHFSQFFHVRLVNQIQATSHIQTKLVEHQLLF